MSTRVEIANRALQKVGAKRIGSFTEGSREADSVNVCFDILLKAELQTNLWTFAIKRASIAADSETPTGRSYQYSLPDDFLRLAPADPSYAPLPSDFLFEGRKVLTSLTAPLKIRYVSFDIDTATVDPLFAEALAARIAMEVSEELTGSASKKDALENAYTFHVSKARQTNSILSGPIAPEEDEWVYTRYLAGNVRNLGPIT